MPYLRKTLTELRSQAQQDVFADPSIGGPFLRVSNTRVLARNNADFHHEQLGYLDYIAKQAVPFTATGEYMLGWAALKKVTQKPPTQAVLQGQITGATPGKTLDAGTLITRADGFEYTSQVAATVSSLGVLSLTLLANEAGAIGNADPGTLISLGSAVPGIPASGTITGSITAGADIESEDDVRSRMLEAFANPAQGGARQDYVTWALEVPGVTRAWVAPLAMGSGTVSVFFMMDDAEAAHGGFPQGTNGVATAETRGSATATGDQLELANYIYSRRAVTAVVYAVAPAPNPVPFTIKLVDPGLQSDVEAAIDDVFLREGTPGGVILPDNTQGGTVALKKVEAALNAVAGIGNFVIVAPTDNIVSGTGQLPTRGPITWA